MPASIYGANLYADYITSTDMYLALCFTYPSDTNTGSTIDEVTAASYERVLLDSANWSEAALGVCTYDAGMVLTLTEDWGLINSYALCDASTAGNVLAFGYLTYSIDARSGSRLKLQAGMIAYEVQ